MEPRTQVKTQPIDRFADMTKLNQFHIISKLGQGTFGVVQKAKSLKTGQTVALKQLINHSAKEGFPITAMREISIVKKLNHQNVLKILDMIYEDPKVSSAQDAIHQRGVFYTVSSYMSLDLVGVLENPDIVLSLGQIKCLMLQLLRGVEYIHDQHYLHRDIKAANILIGYDGVLKIADFGLARVYHGSTPALGRGPGGGERLYTGLVVTRWYRPPELLLGERKYTTAVDMWGVGCVFGELFTCRPIMAGKTDSHQCQLIFQLVGAPTSAEWPEAGGLPNKTDLNIGLTCKRTLEHRFGQLMHDDLAVDLLSNLLALNPYKRYNGLDALNHPFFRSDPLPLDCRELRFEECHEIDKERFKKNKSAVHKINGRDKSRASSVRSSTSVKSINSVRSTSSTKAQAQAPAPAPAQAQAQAQAPESLGVAFFASAKPEPDIRLIEHPDFFDGAKIRERREREQQEREQQERERESKASSDNHLSPSFFDSTKKNEARTPGTHSPSAPKTNPTKTSTSPTKTNVVKTSPLRTGTSKRDVASNIFMPKRKKLRPDLRLKPRPPSSNTVAGEKSIKAPRAEKLDFDSDLTDFDEDVSDNKLEILDLEKYKNT